MKHFATRSLLVLSLAFLYGLTSGPLRATGFGEEMSTPAPLVWNSEVVDPLGSSGPSLVVDGNDIPHLGYTTNYPGFSDNARYAVWGGAAWDIEIVASSFFVGGPVLAVAGNGTSHLLYHDCNPYSCTAFHAVRAGETWSIDPLSEPSGGTLSIAASDDNSVHAAYREGNVLGQTALYYGHYSGGPWVTDIVESTDVSDFALATTPDGQPHISYQLGDGYTLKHAVRQPDLTWSIEIVDTSTAGLGSYNDVALDQAGNPHIIYQAWNEVKHAYRDGAGWHTETVDTLSPPFPHPALSIAVDALGDVHVSYYDEAASSVKYALRQGDLWRYGPVENAANVTSTSIAVDSLNSPHIAYRYYVDEHDRGIVYVRGTRLEPYSYLPLLRHEPVTAD
jgi:hypothetical protein